MRRSIMILLLGIPFCLKAQSIPQTTDSLLSDYTAKHKFSGNVVIAAHGKIIFEKGYGYANLQTNLQNNLQTEFRAASLTKMFTSTLVLQLVEKGRIRLDDKISRFVPGFSNSDKITIKNLLSHTSGIRGEIQPGAITLTQLVTTFKSQPQAFNPGERFEYNNFNYMLLGYIAEKLTGIPYAKLAQVNIFDKSGMRHSGFDHKNRVSNNKALGYIVNPETKLPVKFNDDGDVAVSSSAGSLYTTVGDLYLWSKAIKSNKLLSAATYQLAFAPVIGNYGLGWIADTKYGHKKIGHTGSIEGFEAEFMRFPEDDVTIIFLSNQQNMVDYHVGDILTAIAFKQPVTEQKEKQEIKLPESALIKYTGTYVLNGDKMQVTLKDGKL